METCAGGIIDLIKVRREDRFCGQFWWRKCWCFSIASQHVWATSWLVGLCISVDCSYYPKDTGGRVLSIFPRDQNKSSSWIIREFKVGKCPCACYCRKGYCCIILEHKEEPPVQACGARNRQWVCLETFYLEDVQVSAWTKQHASLVWVLVVKVSLFKRFSFMNCPPIQTSLRSLRITFECPQLNQMVVCLGYEVLIVSGWFSSHRHQSHLGVNESEALQISVDLHSHGDIWFTPSFSFPKRGCWNLCEFHFWALWTNFAEGERGQKLSGSRVLILVMATTNTSFIVIISWENSQTTASA